MDRTPRAVVEDFLTAGRDRDIEAILELMAPDCVLEWPHRPPGVPAQLAGHEAMRAWAASVNSSPIRWDEFRDVVLYETNDPEVVIAEYESHGHLTTTGAPFHQSIIAVFQIRNGHVLRVRDYLDPLKVIEAQATLPGS